IVPEAIDNARENAARNHVENVEFICADAGQAAMMLAARGERPDVLTVDPPRKGLSPEAVEAIVQMEPPRVVYVSCDPATLARDCKLFSERGYRVVQARAFDLFPRTHHVETVCQLERIE
ncbi:MAG: 23S rRNA (uracil(1939)-C(5))-methyltransferase RlmD, partial [Butyricicoccus sp.]